MKKIVINKTSELFYLHLPYAATSQVANDLKELEGVSMVEHSNRYYIIVDVGHAFGIYDVINDVLVHTIQSLIKHGFITKDKDTWIHKVEIEPLRDSDVKSCEDEKTERLFCGTMFHNYFHSFGFVPTDIIVLDHMTLFNRFKMNN